MQNLINPKMVILGRRLRGLTQSQLSKKLGISQAAIAKIEAGQLAPTPKIMNKLAKHLRCPLAFFYKDGDIYPIGARNSV